MRDHQQAPLLCRDANGVAVYLECLRYFDPDACGSRHVRLKFDDGDAAGALDACAAVLLGAKHDFATATP